MLEFLFKKVAGLQTWKFTKKRLQHRCYLVNIKKFLRTAILKNVCERRLLVCYVSVSASFQQPQKTSLELEKVISLCKFAENTSVFLLWNAKYQEFSGKSTTSETVARRCSVKKAFLKILQVLTGKHLWQSLFLKKVEGQRQACSFIIPETPT